MDSLLASYVSSDEDADETLPSPAPAAVDATRRGEGSHGGIRSSIPRPKLAPTFSSLPKPESASTFSSLPPPKSSASSGNPKRVVQFRPQPIHQPTGDSSDEEDDAEKRRPSASEAPPSLSAGSGPVSSFLPAPKHSLGFGSGAARRSAVDTAGPERSNIGAAAAAGPSSSAVNTGVAERADTGAADDDDAEESNDEDSMPAPEEKQEQSSLYAGAGDQQQHGYDTTVGSATWYEGYAWEPNHYGAGYGLDPSGNVNYGTDPQYAAYGVVDQGAGYGNGYVGEHSGGYEHSTAPPSGGEYTGGYRSEVAAMPAPHMHDLVLPPEVGRIGGKRGRKDMPMEILEVNQAELMKNRPREDKSKLTGLAFGPSYQAAPSGKGKPSKLQKRKHQIGSLFYDMKQKEMELSERRSKGLLTKAETHAKYGW